MDNLRKIPTFTFYYILPASLGFVTGLSIKDSLILSNTRKISMSVDAYYKNQDEVIPVKLFTLLQDLKLLDKKKLR